MRQIKIFDTTLRDGEQSPGCSMNINEKIQVAKQLERLGVDVIEAGFAIASKGDFDSVREVARTVQKPIVASLSRALQKDIDVAWDAVRFAKNPRIHTFLATSNIHMKHKLNMSKSQVIERVRKMVAYAKSLCTDIEFSAEDATRSDLDFLYEVYSEAIKAGANVINIPDTVGYTCPDEYYNFIKSIRNNVYNIQNAEISVHCHNDLGLAVANSIAAINAGADQIECTINGIGERAGNAALEEIVMALDTRKDIMKGYTKVNTREIMKSSQLISRITGVFVQPNKSIVGANAFAHESGIHQHGMLQEKSTYEIMVPEKIGISENKLVLGKHSGKHAFADRIGQLGYELSKEDIQKAFEEFKNLADKKKTIYDDDIESIILSNINEGMEGMELDGFTINTGNSITSTSCIRIRKGEDIKECASIGDGPVDASFKAIEKIVEDGFSLKDYRINSLTNGKDAQGEVSLVLEKEGKIYRGISVSTDVIEASIKAYINAVNKYFYREA